MRVPAHAGGRIPRVSHPRTSEYPAAVLFDLDGTLVDPAGGITEGIAHALRLHELPVPTREVLDSLVGPPLAMGLVEIAGVPQDRVQDVVDSYREWYKATGMARSVVYPGIDEALGDLDAAGVRLAVTTAKPEPLAKLLLAMHGLDRRFEFIVGNPAEEAGGHPATESKDHLVRAAAQHLGVDPAACAVVGDRRFDMEAATATGARAVGAAWGFAPARELADAGAEVEVQSPHELVAALLGTEGR